MAIQLQREAKVFVSTVNTGWNNVNTWRLPVMAGFSFTQDTASSDITLNEAGATPTRGQKRFNDALNPVDVSFSTYLRPYKASTAVQAGGNITAADHVDANAVLWEALATANTGSPLGTNVVTGSPFSVSFAGSEVHELRNLYLYFLFDDGAGSPYTAYEVAGFVPNQVDIDFAIDAITQLSWGGQGTGLSESATFGAYYNGAAAAEPFGSPVATTKWGEPPSGNDTFVKNKLTTCTIASKGPGDDGGTWTGSPLSPYTLAITGGNISIANNITYLTPEELGVVNQTIGSFTGTRAISGTLTCYLGSGATPNSKTMFDDFRNNLNIVSNQFAITVNIGGNTAPNMSLVIARGHLNVPTINVEDVISSEIAFVGQGTTGIEATDELVVNVLGNTTWA
jgi:hypothetical protein